VRINFVGDIGVFRRYEELGIDPFREVILPEADLNMGNLEFMISENRKPFFYDVQDHYSCSPAYFRNLFVERFGILGLANNHVLDYGLIGVQDTMNLLDQKKIQYFGFSENFGFSIGHVISKGISFGLIGAVKNGRWSKENFGYGPDTYDCEALCRGIRENKSRFDHLIIYPHWGTELIDIPNMEDTKNAKMFIDAGASAVIGHHPHVPQGLELYKGGIIAYSLGSFIYVNEEELGYSGRNPNRHFSLCLNIEFSKEKISDHTVYYYKYNQTKRIPEPLSDDSISHYATYLNENIYNEKLFRKLLFKVFIRREVKSFLIRFKQNPVKTSIYYTGFLLNKVLNKVKGKG
jgi:poly-gamma-glutamate synthesis protein (capsule biosynthesis protein)